MSIFKKLKDFYNASNENKIQVYICLAFIVIPIIGMSSLYAYVMIFWM
jgi:hypothetical protein